MSDPAFDVLADAVERAVHRYRHADAQQVDPVRAKAELIAVCDILSRQPAPDLDPVPAGVVEGALDAIRDHIAARARFRRPALVRATPTRTGSGATHPTAGFASATEGKTMSNSLKLSTALPGEDEINGLDSLADDLVADPSRMICAVIICDVKDVRYITDLEAHVPTLRFRRGEAWPLADTPEAVRIAMIQRSEARLGRTPLPFGEVAVKPAEGKDRPNPDDCDHVEFTIERDHLEDVPDGQFRETCLRCGFYRYQPVADLPDALARIDAQAGPNLFADGDSEPAPVRPDDAPEVWVYGDDDDSGRE